jgi:hypothetical protein
VSKMDSGKMYLVYEVINQMKIMIHKLCNNFVAKAKIYAASTEM